VVTDNGSLVSSMVCLWPTWMPTTAFDSFFQVYFLLHAVLAVVVDAQCVAPPSLLVYYEKAGLTAVVSNWVTKEGDFLVGELPPWFVACIWAELLFQVPACIVLSRLWRSKREAAKGVAITYSLIVLATMVPIFSALLADARPTLVCKSVYALWMGIPLCLLLRSTTVPLFAASVPPSEANRQRRKKL